MDHAQAWGFSKSTAPNIDHFSSPESPTVKLGQFQVLEELEARDAQAKESLTEASAFIKTVHQHHLHDERDAFVIKHTKQMLTQTEVAAIETAIAFPRELVETGLYQNDFELLGTQICWALMLYYSLPLGKVKKCLIGTPGLDFSRAKMTDQVVVDIERRQVCLPSPMNALDETNRNLEPVTLPLHRRLGALLRYVKTNQNRDKHELSDLLPPESFIKAKSFRSLNGFRQYRITNKKVSNFLWQNVQLTTQDEVKTSYLQGGSYPLLHMGLYYTRLKASTLRSIYINVCENVFEGARFCKAPKESENKSHGSVHSPELGDVEKFIASKASHLKTLAKQKHTSGQALCNYHNELALYTVILLNLATTHRPHKDPFHALQNFIDDRWVQISEKVIKEGLEGRLSVLNQTCIDQIKTYCQHLTALSSVIDQAKCSKFSKALRSVTQKSHFSREGLPLFFYIDDFAVKPISKKIINEYLHSVEGVALKDNFFRHLFSTFMAEGEVARIHIAAQMGHISKGMEAYSPNLDYSPIIQERSLKPHINALFDVLKVKAFSPKYAPYYLATPLKLSYQPWRLGPFERLDQRTKPIGGGDLNLIDQTLFTGKAPSSVYVTLKTQNAHAEQLKAIFPKRTRRKLRKYYDYHKKHSGWRFETKQARKSPYDWHFARKFRSGQQSIEQFWQRLNAHRNCLDQLSEIDKRCLLSLSALFSGTIRHRKQLLAILNLPRQAFQDAQISLAVSLEDKNGNQRLWILNSPSILIAQQLRETETEPLTEKHFNKWLNSNGFPKLGSLILGAQAYFQVHLPGYLTYYADKSTLQNSLPLENLQTWLRGQSVKAVVPLSSTWQPSQPTATHSNDNSSEVDSKALKRLAGLLSSSRTQRMSHDQTAKALDQMTEEGFEFSHFIAELLLKWVQSMLADKHLSVSSIYDYFNRVYLYVLSEFVQHQELEEFDDETLQNEVYPSILETMQQDFKSGQPLPTSELKSFHQFLVKTLGFMPLHFEGGHVVKPSQFEPIVTPEIFNACLRAIDADQNLLTSVKEDLQLAFILYAKLGLRLSEIFYLQTGDIDLVNQQVHVHGNRNTRLKRPASNRLIHYPHLLEPDEQRILEKTLSRSHEPETGQLLLFNSGATPKESVKKFQTARYLVNLIRSVSGEPFTIKSLRKTFASSVFLKLAFEASYKHARKRLRISDPLAETFITEHFGTDRNGWQKFWLLASFMGHTTPQTTFESYTLTMELMLFSETERHLEDHREHLKLLEKMQTLEPISRSTIRNLNRYSGGRYIHFYQRYLSGETETHSWGNPFYADFFKTKITLDALEKSVFLLSRGHDYQAIGPHIGFSNDEVAVIASSYQQIIREILGDSIPLPLEQRFVDLMSFQWLEKNVWHSKRRPKSLEGLFDAMTQNSTGLGSEIFRLWRAQIGQMIDHDGEWFFHTEADLKKVINFLTSFDIETLTFNVRVLGIKHEDTNVNSLPVDFSNGNYCVEDLRKKDVFRPAFSHFTLAMSTRSANAKKPASCRQCFNFVAFFSALIGLANR